MPFLDEIANKLVIEGVGRLGIDIFLSSDALIPIGDGPYMTIIETGGSGPSRTQDTVRSTQRPTAQLFVRAANYRDAREMSVAAYNVLDGLYNTLLSGTFYVRIVARQEPTDLGTDEANRAMVVFNIEAEKQPS